MREENQKNCLYTSYIPVEVFSTALCFLACFARCVFTALFILARILYRAMAHFFQWGEKDT